MTDRAKPSGPLWATTNDAGVLSHYSTITSEQPGDQPCRLIPGHGKVVPLDLVEAVVEVLKWRGGNTPCPCCDDDRYLRAATDAALGGAM